MKVLTAFKVLGDLGIRKTHDCCQHDRAIVKFILTVKENEC